MRITAARVRNYKRIHDIKITPDADRVLILIGGKNAQGKSSLLDALTVAFGGKRAQASDPVRHGADDAEITVELDGGEMTIRRVIEADGESKLELRDRAGALRSPQQRLDKLVGARFLDPIAFLQLAPAQQRAQLLAMFDADGAIAKIDEHRDRVYARRTDVGRDLKRAEGELARLAEAPVEPAIDVAALAAERAALADKQRAGDGLGQAHKAAVANHAAAERLHLEAMGEYEALAQRLEDMARRVARLAEDRARAATAEVSAKERLDAAAAEWAEIAPRREHVDAELARADAHNRAVFEAEANNRRRTEAAATVGQLAEQTRQQTELLERIEKQKTDILAAAKLPVDGLGVSTDGITLNGVPFAQASAAERLRVSLALAMAGSPNLDDVWIRDGALLDDEHLELIAKLAERAGKVVWVERVGDRDPGAIVIHDGRVVEQKDGAK